MAVKISEAQQILLLAYRCGCGLKWQDEKLTLTGKIPTTHPAVSELIDLNKRIGKERVARAAKRLEQKRLRMVELLNAPHIWQNEKDELTRLARLFGVEVEYVTTNIQVR